jgi:hypothetical protein
VSKSTYPVRLPTSIKKAAAELAASDDFLRARGRVGKAEEYAEVPASCPEGHSDR